MDSMLLNQDVDFRQVRWAVSRVKADDGRVVSYDKAMSFVGVPLKIRLDRGAHLFRLDYLATNEWAVKPWWIQELVFRKLLDDAQKDPEAFRKKAEEGLALEEKEYKRLAVMEIVLKQPVFGWVGLASAIQDQPGGLEQVLLPNLHIRGDWYHSAHAALHKTYSIPVK
jgi:hypothetical protein